MEIAVVVALIVGIGAACYAVARLSDAAANRLESVLDALYEMTVGRWWDKRELAKASPVFGQVHRFATSVSSDRVATAIVQRWGRTPPTGPSAFYVHSVTDDDVVLHLGNHVRDRFCGARIHFDSRNPAAGTLSFFDTASGVGYEEAQQLPGHLAELLAAIAPGSTVAAVPSTAAVPAAPQAIRKQPSAPSPGARGVQPDPRHPNTGTLFGPAGLGLAAVAFLLTRLLPQATYTYPNGEVYSVSAPAWYLIAAIVLGVALLVLAIAIVVAPRPVLPIAALVLSIVAIVLVAMVAQKLTASVEMNAAAGLILAALSALAAVVASIWCVTKPVLDAAKMGRA